MTAEIIELRLSDQPQGDRFMSDEEYQQSFPSVVRVLQKEGESLWAEDLTQEAIIAHARYPKEHQTNGLIYTIARNRRTDLYRRSRVVGMVSLDSMTPIERDDLTRKSGLTTETDALNDQSIGNLDDLMIRLQNHKPKQAEALKLFYWEQLDIKTIAEMMELSTSHVKHLLMNGRFWIKNNFTFDQSI